MRFNRRLGALHHRDANVDRWIAVQAVERDVCLMLHQQSVFASLEPDLYWGLVYVLPYWDWLDCRWLEDRDREFLRDGCLLILMGASMAWAGGVNAWIESHDAECRRGLDALPRTDARTDRLARAVGAALEAARLGRGFPDSLWEEARWAQREYVFRYFQERTERMNASL